MEVRVYATLRPIVGGRSVDVPETADTVAKLLSHLVERFPGLRERLFADEGGVRPFVAVMVDGRDIRHTGGLDTAVPPDAVIDIFPPVAGGAQTENGSVELAIRGLPEWLIRKYLSEMGAAGEEGEAAMRTDRWAVRWSSRRVSLAGGSGLGLTQFDIVFEGPPDLLPEVEEAFMKKAQRGGG
jgi:molybdopterin synthase sulfur carrier subunit